MWRCFHDETTNFVKACGADEANLDAQIARAVPVEPFELLNHDMEIDDVAYIVEEMRVNDGVKEVVREKISGLALNCVADGLRRTSP